MLMKFVFESQNLYLVVIALVSGGMLLWPMVRRRAVGGATLSTAQMTMLMNREDAVVIDLREPEAFAGGHVLHARNVPAAQIEARMQDLARLKNRPFVLYDDNGNRAAQSIALFKKHGVERVLTLAGGYAGWRAAGLPIQK